jgi:hypothetical protein
MAQYESAPPPDGATLRPTLDVVDDHRPPHKNPISPSNAR